MTTAAGLAGAEIVCRTLQALGASHVFGMPGTQNVPFYEALRRSPMRSIVPTHELAAAFMAGAFHRAGGGPGVLATIPGPGLVYALAGLAEARLDSAAILHIVNGRGADATPGYGPQAIDAHALLAPVTKAIVSVGRLEAAEAAVHLAWDLALGGEPGPVVLELSVDPDALPLRVIGTSTEPAEAPDEAAIVAAWGQIAAARKPVIIAGQGALGAAAAVAALAERLGAPVLTTPSARGLLTEISPRAMGFDVLRGTTEAANRLLEAADAVLVLGAKLAHNGSAGAALRIPEAKCVRVDTSPEVLATTYPAAHRLVMDVGCFLARAGAHGGNRSDWHDEELAIYRTAMRTPVPRSEADIAGAAAGDFFAALGAALPADVRLVTDTGMHQVMARRHLDVRAPGGLLLPSDLQSMGFGLPAAIAAALADPHRKVVALIGDGGLRMTGFEIATAVREKVPLTVIVLDDGCLGQIRLQQLAEHGVANGTELGPLDIAAFADAVGARHVLIESPAALSAAIAGSLARPGVTLVEVPVGDTRTIRVGALKARAKGAARSALGSGALGRLKGLIKG